MVITMAKLRMAHASTHGARKPPGPISTMSVFLLFKASIQSRLPGPTIVPGVLAYLITSVTPGQVTAMLLPYCSGVCSKSENDQSLNPDTDKIKFWNAADFDSSSQAPSPAKCVNCGYFSMFLPLVISTSHLTFAPL